MIDPREETDIGRRVRYTPRDGGPIETGYISSINSRFVFVRFGDERHSKACQRADLTWAGDVKACISCQGSKQIRGFDCPTCEGVGVTP